MKNGKEKNKTKTIANASLAFMLIGTVATYPFTQTGIAMKIINTGFEAGLVGAIADWYSITALFRHPLKLKIPHTALLPNNREKISEAILNVVQNDWLKKETIIEKTKNVEISKIILRKAKEELKKEENQEKIKKLFLSNINEKNIIFVQEKLLKIITENIYKTDSKKVLYSIIDKVIEQKNHEQVYDLILDGVYKKTQEKENKEKIVELIVKSLKKKTEDSLFGVVLKPIFSAGEEKIKTTVISFIDAIYKDLKEENSENRKKIINTMKIELQKLKLNENAISILENKKEEIAKSDILKKEINDIVRKYSEDLKEKISEKKLIEYKIIPMIEKYISKLEVEEEKLEKIDQKLKKELGDLIEKNHSKIGLLVKENLDKLNNDELVDMMENKIGKELSWIRVNGAIVGSLVGIGIGGLKILMDGIIF